MRGHKAILVCLLILLITVVLGSIARWHSLASRREVCSEVIRRVQSGELGLGQTGVVRLPQELSRASIGGEVYAASPRSGLWLVAFKTWQGKAYNMEGVLFCSQPLTPADIQKDYYGDSVIQVGPAPLVLEKQIDANWYEVSYRLD